MVLQQPALALTLATLARIVSIAGTARKKAENVACANDFPKQPKKREIL
jgi:hypothetical protein